MLFGGGPHAGPAGATPRAAISSGGKSVAKGDGDVSHQPRLVRFDGEQVIAALVKDRPADRALTEFRAAGDDTSRQWQGLQKSERGGDLVRARLDAHLPGDRSQPAGEGRDQMHTLAAIMSGGCTAA
jgi:hypothetical protein